MRCEDCDRNTREIAELADLCAFWAFQAKWYFAKANKLGNYDELPPANQKAIDATFEEHRRAENRERLGTIPPSYDIGS